MVANPDIERPDSPDYLINKLRALEQRLNELTSRSPVPFQAGKSLRIFQDPTYPEMTDLQILYGDGSGIPVQAVAPGASGNGQWSVFDRAGTAMLATDDGAGFGMAAPLAQATFQVSDPPALGTSSTSEVMVQNGFLAAINPGFQVALSLKGVASAGTLTGRGRMRVWDSGIGLSSYSSYVTLSTAGTQYVTGPAQATLLSASAMGRILFIEVLAQVTGGAGTIYPSVSYATGAAKAAVDAINFW